MLPEETRKKPLIGITTGRKPNRFALWAMKQAVRLAGGRPLQISPTSNVDQTRNINGLIISGGNDINPELYERENTASVNIDKERDWLEMECLMYAYDEKLPVLGVCRGAQMINVSKGGTLHQDAPSVFEGFVPTDSTVGKVLARKKIDIQTDSRLARILLNGESIWVNSLHHQVQDKIGEGLREVACDQYGIVQAVEYENPRQFIVGVQWHPEYMLYSGAQRRLFKALTAASLTISMAKSEEETCKPIEKGLLSFGNKAA